MVQKYHSPIRVYKYPFELVMAAYERRFPSCDMIPVFEGSEIISEERSEDGAEIVVTRRCKLNVDAPYLLKKIAGVDYFYCLQKNILDLRSRTLKIEAWNESFSNRIIIQEYCTYFVHPENQEWTCFEQSASLEVKSFFGFENAVEKLSSKHYAASIKKGKEVIEFFIEELKKDGITHIEPFKESSINSNGKLLENENKENEKLANNKPELSTNNNNSKPKLPQANDTPIEDRSVSVSVNDKQQQPVEDKNISIENTVIKEEIKKISPNKTNNITSTQVNSGNNGTTVPPATLTTQQKRDLMKKQQTSFSTEANFPSTNANMKLEADYIQKCIGEMTPYQESCLVQLKKQIIETHYNQGNQTNMSMKKKIPSDQTLMRFLLARNYNLDRAREMLCASLVWRKKHQVDKILSTYNLPEVVQKYYPGCWLNNDKDGRPVYMLMIGQMDLKGFVRSIGQEGLVKLTLLICEQGLKKAEEATKKFGKPISSWTLLLDLDGLNMRHLWRPGIKTVLHIIEILENNYPETLGRVIMTRAPRIFPIIWTMLSTFINENTYRKFIFLGDLQELKVLEQFINIKDIPKLLGGKLDNPPALILGSLIPKSHYMSDEKANELNLLDNTMYTNVSLTKGQTHEILYDIKDSQSVICWDFDVLKQDITFNLYRLNSNLATVNSSNSTKETPSKEETIKIEKSQSKDNLNNNLVKKQSSKENVNSGTENGVNVDKKTASQDSINEINDKQLQNRLSGDAACGMVIPKSWQLNKDYQQIEPELLCREGDSIQGSHITSKPSKYVLQWKYTDPVVNHHHSFTSHRAKFMLYTEIIKSKTFKGSMTSLSSLHSSHSGTTSCQSSANGSCPSN